MKRAAAGHSRTAGSWVGILGLAAALRIPLLFGGLPYMGYVDEGHVLHRVQRLLATSQWDPGWYQYPSLTIYGITATVRAAAPVYSWVHGKPLTSDLPADEEYYDAVSPPAIIVCGRLVVLFASLATVAVGVALARRVGGDGTALVSGLLLAACPSLLQRSTVVIVDSVAALLTATTLLLAWDLRAAASDGDSPRRAAGFASGAGFAAGLAAAAKYPAASVFVVVAAAVLAGPGSLRRRLALLVLAAGSATAGALLAMPALLLRTREVVDALLEQTRFYSSTMFVGTTSLLRQGTGGEELGPVVFAAACLGFGLLLLRRESRLQTLAWLAFGAALLGPLLRYPFQPFRNALPLVPIALVAAAFFVDRGPLTRTSIARIGLTALLLISFLPGTIAAFQSRRVVDSRTALVDVLARPERMGRRVLVQRELAILPSELARVRGRVVVAPWESMPRLAASGKFDDVVFGVFKSGEPYSPDWLERARDWERQAARYRVVSAFGNSATSTHPNFWRYNDEFVVLARIRGVATESGGRSHP